MRINIYEKDNFVIFMTFNKLNHQSNKAMFSTFGSEI